MKNFMQAIVVLVGILLVSEAAAADKVVIIPPDLAKKRLMNVVTVSAEGGQFTNPIAAVISITDASAANQYLVWINPGVYTLTQTLVMKPYVTIVGSGRDATILTGAISSTLFDASSAIVAGADNATLSDLTIENTGGSAVSMGMYNSSSSPVIENVNAKASGGTYCYGIYNEYSSSPVMTEVNAKATGGTYNYNVFNSSSQ